MTSPLHDKQYKLDHLLIRPSTSFRTMKSSRFEVIIDTYHKKK